MNTAKYRPNSHIIAVTGREKILRRLNIIWGVRGIIIPDFVADTDSAFRRINEELRRRGYVESGDYVVYTAGIPLLSQGSTNSIKVEKVE
jgi:pyruvate kinase